ncbi:hypothetical protein [Streptomyces sp. NPDC102487]
MTEYRADDPFQNAFAVLSAGQAPVAVHEPVDLCVILALPCQDAIGAAIC